MYAAKPKVIEMNVIRVTKRSYFEIHTLHCDIRIYLCEKWAN